MTSNAGSREISSHAIGFGDPKSDRTGKGKKAIERYFSPEFRNRLDAIITFKSLTLDIMEMVVDKFMAEFSQQLSIKKVRIKYSDDCRTWMAKRGYDPQYGARPLARLLQTEIKDILADEILFGRLEKGGKVDIDVKNNELKFEYSK